MTLEQFSAVVVMCSAAATAISAVVGLMLWRRQAAAKIEYDLASAVMISVYEFRDAMDYVRFPVMAFRNESELPKEKYERLSGDERRVNALTEEYEARWAGVREASAKLDSAALKAKVAWRDKLAKPILELKEIRLELLRTIRMYLLSESPNSKYTIKEEDYQKFDSVMYGSSDDQENEFSQRLRKSIDDIERLLERHIRIYHQ